MQARLPPLELPRSGSQGSAVILTTLSARLLRAPLRALTIQLLRLSIEILVIQNSVCQRLTYKLLVARVFVFVKR